MAKPRAIEATGKRWKLLKMLGGVVLVVGLLWAGVAYTAGDVPGAFGGIWAAGVGGGIRLLGLSGAWWFHG